MPKIFTSASYNQIISKHLLKYITNLKFKAWKQIVSTEIKVYIEITELRQA
jgi:hypothetical protein